MHVAPNRFGQPVHVRPPPLVVELDRIPGGERLEQVGKVCRAGHRCALNEHRNHPHAAFERFGELAPHVIGGIVQTAAAVAIHRGETLTPHDCEKDAARRDAMRHRFDEIVARRNRVQVAKDLVRSEFRRQRVAQPARVAGRIVATIADENVGHGNHRPSMAIAKGSCPQSASSPRRR